jgi:hypothetical protein
MILYHGSNLEIDSVDLEKCRFYKDFGRGFYTTTIKEQARRMAYRTTKRFGGKSCVTSFSFDETLFSDSRYKILHFEIPCEEWTVFVINNRDPKFKDIHNASCNTDYKYDIVWGPVANDDLVFIFNQYSNGLLPLSYLVEQMKFKKLTEQISFHTPRIIKNLQKTGAEYDGNSGMDN